MFPGGGMEPDQGLHLAPGMQRVGLVGVQAEVIPHLALGSEAAFDAYRRNWIETIAGLAESPGRTILYQGRTFKVYRGMGSLGAMVKGSSERYRQGDVDADNGKLVPEGVEGRVPFKGPLSDFVYQLVGGLRAGMGYCGTRTIDELRKDSQFIQVSAASVRESHAHDIAIRQESLGQDVVVAVAKTARILD